MHIIEIVLQKSRFEEQSIGLPLQVTKSIFRIQMMRILILPFFTPSGSFVQQRAYFLLALAS